MTVAITTGTWLKSNAELIAFRIWPGFIFLFGVSEVMMILLFLKNDSGDVLNILKIFFMLNYHKAPMSFWIRNKADWVQNSCLSSWLLFRRGVLKRLGDDNVDKNDENGDNDEEIDKFFQNDVQCFLKNFLIFS